MRFASKIVAFLIVFASLAGPCFAASKTVANHTGLSKNSIASLFLPINRSSSENIIKAFATPVDSAFSEPCKDECQKKQCTKAVISRVVTQVRFVLLPINDGPITTAPYKARLRDRKLSNLFAKNVRPCNRSVDLFALCRQLN